MHILRFLFRRKNENVIEKSLIALINFAQDIYYGYSLEPPRRCDSNEYPQCVCFGAKIRKIGILLYTPVSLYKNGI